MVFEHTVQQEESHALFHLKGELIEKGQAAALLEDAERLLKVSCVKWAIDMEELRYMNSSGLNILIQLLTKARVAGGEAVIYNMNKKINELILITKLNTLFKIAVNKEEAYRLLDLN